MANTITPNQELNIDPNTPIFQFNNVSSRAFYSFMVNRLNGVVGKNVIIDGLLIQNPTIDNVGKVSVSISPGSCIISSNYINITSTTNLDLSVADYQFNGGIIIHAQFLSMDSINNEKVVLRMSVLGPDKLTYPNSWIFNRDTLILGYLLYSKSPYSLTNMTPNIGSQSFLIRIVDRDYEVRPTGNILSELVEKTTPTYEIIQITSQIYNNGYFELESAPISDKFLELSIADAGLNLVSKAVVTDLSIPIYYFEELGVQKVKKPADYQLIGRKVFIKDSQSWGVEGLSNNIAQGMVLIARYLHG